jgi:cyclomaltodextrinase
MSKNPYPDHIFSLAESPAKSARKARQRVLGVHHWGAKGPFRPEPGDRVLLRASTSTDLSVTKLRVATTTDDWKRKEIFHFKAQELVWDNYLWGWVREWLFLLPVQEAGVTLRYKIWADLTGNGIGESTQVFADNQAGSFEAADGFAIYYGADATPEWAQRARIYQIFVDRFNPGEGSPWLQTERLDQPMGGTLRGITEKLRQITDMGFNCLWLTPIFASPSHHGYDTSNYFEVEPRFGNKKDLQTLIEHAHKLGLRVLLDFVANHSSNQHSAMQAALANPKAAETAWFHWKRWPKYDAFFDVQTMPNLDLRFGAPAREYLLQAARYWLEFGADGFRCDYASGPSPDFWVDFRRVCRETKPDSWFFGEVILSADEQRAFSGGLDGTLDFLTCQAIRETIGRKAWPLSKLTAVLLQEEEYFTPEFSRPAFIDNHDMNRFYFTAEENQALLRIALTLLYLLPQPPTVYFGTENLLSQHQSIHAKSSIGFDEARLPMEWGKEATLAPLLKQLADLRERHPQLLEAGWTCERVDDKAGILVLKREIDESWDWLFVINLGSLPMRLPVERNCRVIKLPGTLNSEISQGQLALGPENAALLEVYKGMS